MVNVSSKNYHVKNIFHRNGQPQNGLPINEVGRCVNTFISNKFNPNAKEQNDKIKTNLVISLPYVEY